MKGGNFMADIEKAYHILLGAASESIDLLEHGNVWDCRALLKTALSEAEEAAIQDDADE